MNFYTADTHFSFKEDKIIKREFRPFKNLEEMNTKIIEIWNSQVREDDVVYVLGDFVNYNYFDNEYEQKFKLVKKIKAKVILVLGNGEGRILNNDFDNNFDEFKKYLLSLGFFNVYKKTKVKIGKNEWLLTHKPEDCDKTNEFNLFGHVHKSVFVKKYGFNVGVDNHYFRLFSEEDVLEMHSRRNLFDKNVYE